MYRKGVLILLASGLLCFWTLPAIAAKSLTPHGELGQITDGFKGSQPVAQIANDATATIRAGLKDSLGWLERNDSSPRTCAPGYAASPEGYVVNLADWSERAGLRRGDKIISIAGVAVAGPEDRARGFAQVPAGGPLVIGITRGKQRLAISLPCFDDVKVWTALRQALVAGANGEWDTCLASAEEGERLQGFVPSNTLDLKLQCTQGRTLDGGKALGAAEARLTYERDLTRLQESRHVPGGFERIRGEILKTISWLRRLGLVSLATALEAELRRIEKEVGWTNVFFHPQPRQQRPTDMCGHFGPETPSPALVA